MKEIGMALLKIGVTLLMLVCATVGYGASYLHDFENGPGGVDVSSGPWLFGTVTNGLGVGGSRAELRARTDLPNRLTWIVGDVGLGGPSQFRGNWQTQYGEEFKISWAMQDGDYASGSLVNFGLFVDSPTTTLQWQKTFPTALSLSSFTTYDTGVMGANWTDAEALAAGWTKLGSVSWSNTVRSIRYFTLQTDGGGSTHSNGVPTVVFADGGDPADGAILDNILIQTFVPEPSTPVLLVAGAGPVSAADAVLARDGVAAYVITIAADATEPERHAAEELASFLKQVTGTAFPIKPPAEAAGAPCLAVGPGAARAIQPDLDLNSLGADGIVIRGLPGERNHLLLTGGVGAPRGTLYAVHTFLENEVGCRWWTRTESSIPNKPTLAVKAELDVRYVPPLEFRDQCFNEGMDGIWALRHKLTGWCSPGDSVLRGGGLMYAGNIHSFFSLVPPKEHFDKHPEWYAEINGKRTVEGQLCLTNPELLQVVIGRVKVWLKECPLRIKPAFVSVSQNDCAGWCTCPRCKAVDEAEGSQSGTMIRFVNAVAEGIEPDYPNVAVHTFAYQYSRKPPKLVRPRRNVVVQLCSIECDFAHPMADDRNRPFWHTGTSPAGRLFREDLEGWSRICDRLYIWDYATNFRYFFQAHPNLRVLGPNIRFFVRNGVKGVFEQGSYESPGAALGALRAWVIGKLLWNPALDDRALIEEFLSGYYGPAAPALRRYLNLIHDTMAESGYRLTMFMTPNAPHLTPEILAQSAALVEEAKAAVAGQQEFLRRVEIVEMSILFSQILRGCNRVEDAFGKDGKVADQKATLGQLDRFAAIARREKFTRISEGGAGDLDAWVESMRRVILAAGPKESTEK